MLKDIVIVWIFGGVISAILAAYWWRGALNGEGSGGKHRLRWLGSWRRMADRNRCLHYREIAIPFILLPMELYAYAQHAVRKKA